ncbi:MAG: type III secretion system export apparatus subunit SctV [bacterium]
MFNKINLSADKFSLTNIKNLLLEGDIVGILTRYSDILLAFLVTSIIGLLIIPIHPRIMDILLTLNITIAVTILLVAIYLQSPIKLSVFPSILLITTLFRLGLNVSSTRLILLYAYAGEVINAFGNFVVAGNYVVGAVIFLIITIIQFIVISKGSERVAEVAARFSLDAMPGKQMSIDADMRAGVINVTEAKHLRNELARESQFYGSMDGAMKFVKGDAIAGIIIAIINIIGGLTIGTLQMGMDLTEALETFTILTIGDGLVSQIPALIISISAGMVVTRVASEEVTSNLGKDIGMQILTQPKPMAIVAALLFGFAIIPGLPFFPFFLLSLVTAAIALGLFKTNKIQAEKMKLEKQLKPAQVEEQKGGFLPVSPLVLEVSESLTPLVDSQSDGGIFLNETIPKMREILFYETGVQFPPIRIRGGNTNLAPEMYVIKINEVPLITGRMRPGMCLVNEESATLKLLNIPADETINPADGSSVCWISEEQKEIVRKAGYKVWETTEIMVLHLNGVLRRYSYEFLGLQEVKTILENTEKVYPAVVETVVPKIINLLQLTDILQRLLQEDISIRDMRTILQSIAEWGAVEKDTVMLTEYVRQGLKRYITHKYTAGKEILFVYLLDPQIEEMVSNAIQHTPSGNYLALVPEITYEILDAIKKEIQNLPATAQKPVILTSQEIRRYVRKLVEIQFPHLAVLSYQELTPEITIQPLGRIKIK